uniref:CONSTANS-like protein n=1 Tax=Kalanchoe fedtschenkoi TaxID=63787 RepID=A0A7N0TAT7_KALFE
MGEAKKLPTWPTATPAAAAAIAASKLCDSCKSATATLFCRNDSAFLCVACDSKIHAANKLASRHARVWMCEVCEQAPAHVTCKADAAALCVTCDRDIHSANPLARRHERLPVVPFYDSAAHHGGDKFANGYFVAACDADEAEAASWLMPNLNSKLEDPEQAQASFNMYADVDPYLDLDFGPKDFQNKQEANHEHNSSGADGVVPEQCNKISDAPTLFAGNGAGDDPCFDVDFIEPAKGFPYFASANAHSISHSVSSSSHEVGVVPDGGTMIDVSNPFGRQSGGEAAAQAVPLFGAEREARVMRYREKRKSRKFEKTIRYASRKAYAETRPRIKGRFAKRADGGDVAGVEQMYDMNSPAIGGGEAYGVVPSY